MRGAAKWFFEFFSPDHFQGTSITSVLHTGQTKYQSVEVLTTGAFGRCLVLDGKIQSAELDEFIYHEALVHPSMLAHARPRRVFIAGGGEGATAREVLKHKTVEQVVMADIDGEVVELCRRYLQDRHGGAFEDRRLELHIEDARAVLERVSGAFDVIVLDLPDPIEAGPASLLYTEGFYALVREKLGAGGVMVTQSGPCNITNLREVFSPIHNTLKRVFPLVAPYHAVVPAFGGSWGFNLASLGRDPRAFSKATVDRALASRGGIATRFYDGESHAGMFSLPRYLRDGLAQETRVITEDSPIFLY